MKADLKICSHLVIMTRLRTGISGLACMSEEDIACGCCKDGDCPIYEERQKRLKEILDRDGFKEIDGVPE